jgi:hypothetical protein
LNGLSLPAVAGQEAGRDAAASQRHRGPAGDRLLRASAT